jgi:replicative DNA helicase
VALQVRTPATSRAEAYATIVTDCATQRALIGAGAEISELGFGDRNELDATLDAATAMVLRLADRRRRNHQTLRLGDQVEEWIEELDRRVDAEELPGLSTGLRDLDELLLGLRGGQLIIAAGRPGVGKSSLAGHLAAHVSAQDKVVHFASLEMSIAELQDRFFATAAKVPWTSLRDPRGMNSMTKHRLKEAARRQVQFELHLEDDASATVASIRSSARRLKATKGLDLIIVDYLQLMTPLLTNSNRAVEVATLSRGLKELALQLDVPVVALAQLNRQLELRTDKRPRLSDLRESGSIENDADIVVFLHPHEDDEGNLVYGVLELIVAKQRNGPRGMVRVHHEASTGVLANLSRGAA